ncbi:MAG: lytic transglycosylase domain-containing protein [Spirochaetaceae bacterium]|jgi:soluble lytic murein transglycosylase|nr:lytic transglycosylase domain-containing protein [Spirochaetaceae bacterium]
MDVSRDEAARRLKAGDIGFILSAETSRVNELAKLDPSSPFYAGLLVENARDKRRAAYLFEAALGSPILKVGKESARRLIPLLAELQDPEIANRVLQFMQKNKNAPEEEFVTLKAAAAYVLGRYGEVNSLLRGTESGTAAGLPEHLAAWNRAFQFLAALKQQIPGILPSTETRKFFLDFPAGAASRWAYEEILKSPGYIFPAAERTAVTGRLAVFGGAYSEALVHFESLKNSPLLFQHPLLLGDMGRSYAAVSSKREAGFKLFTDWENALRTGRNSPAPALTEDQVQAVRYTLLFYTGRIRRQQGKHGEAVDYFTRALALTRDTVQEDACIWYILSSTFTEKPETVPALIKTYAPLWNNDDDFYDILDKLSCYLMTEKKWRSLQDVFDYIRNSKDGATVAKYAYLVGRAVSLGYISGREGMDTRDYFTVAYEAGNASFYYRALAASYLGKVVSPTERGRGAGNSAAQYPHRAELEFYAKFFEFGAAPYAMTYLRENADRYTKHELRVAARTFASAGRYLESIQIVGMYMRRDDYVMETVDLELYYPNPFTSLIEKYAQANGLLPQVFFGLIRTESAFIPDIASHAGAVGLAQIMPSTATEIAAIIKKGGGPDFSANGNIDLTDPEINVQMGAVYLKSLTDSLGSPMLALLAYNGGPGRIRRLRRAVPSLPEDLFIETIGISETRNYGKRVMAAAAAYGFLYYGMSMHEVVADIFK